VGKGTTFVFFFPRAQGAIAESLKSAPQTPLAVSAETLLVVEDDLSVRRLLCKMLETQGHRVLSARTGVRLKVLRDHKGTVVRLVITDVIMPEMDGEIMAKRFECDPSQREGTLYIGLHR